MVGQAGDLKVEIRLQAAITRFAAALNEEDHKTFGTLRKLGPPPGTEIIKLTEELNRRLSPFSRPYGTRLVGFFEAIQVYARAGDVIVGGAQNLIASGVWACVRFSLEVRWSLIVLGITSDACRSRPKSSDSSTKSRACS